MKLDERSLAMHLYVAYQGVLACKESMWEELQDRIRKRDPLLTQFGWDSDEELEPLEARSRFEILLERYARYVVYGICFFGEVMNQNIAICIQGCLFGALLSIWVGSCLHESRSRKLISWSKIGSTML